MQLDVRVPLGLMLVIMGVLLVQSPNTVTFNGKPLSLPTGDNKVKTLTFTAEGYRPE